MMSSTPQLKHCSYANANGTVLYIQCAQLLIEIFLWLIWRSLLGLCGVFDIKRAKAFICILQKCYYAYLPHMGSTFLILNRRFLVLLPL